MARFLLITFYLCCGHQTVGFLVFHHVNIVFFATLHTLFLFAEGTEQVFHQSPIQEGPIFIGPCTLHPCEFSDFCYRMLCGSDGSLVLIEIDKHFYLITDAHIFCDVTVWQEDISLVAPVQVQSVVCTFLDSQCMIFS